MTMGGRRTIRLEDYLQAVAEVCESSGARAMTGLVADRLQVANGTASMALQTLAQAGWVDHIPYEGVILTDVGERRFQNVLRRQRLIERYLLQTLGEHGLVAAIRQAREIESVVSAELIELIERYLESSIHAAGTSLGRDATAGRTAQS